MSSRRTLLVVGSALLASGCIGTGPDASADGSPADGESPSSTDDRTVTSETPACIRGFYVSADPFDPPEDLPADFTMAPEPLRELVREVVENEVVEIPTYGGVPLQDGLHLRREGVFYRLSVELTDGTGVPARLTNLEWEAGQTAPDGADVVAFEDLPESDRRALRLLVYGTEYASPYQHPEAGLSARNVPAPYPDGTDGSQLVGAGTTWVHWDDRVYRVEVTTETASVTRRIYRLVVSKVATDEAAFRQQVVDRYLVTLDDLPDGERDILSTATDGTYEECDPASDALDGLRERLSAHEQLPPRYEDSWFVAFDDDRYELAITNWVH